GRRFHADLVPAMKRAWGEMGMEVSRGTSDRRRVLARAAPLGARGAAPEVPRGSGARHEARVGRTGDGAFTWDVGSAAGACARGAVGRAEPGRRVRADLVS